MKYLSLVFLSLMIVTAKAATKDQLSQQNTAAFLPANIYKLDSKFSHHVIVVEKFTHKLHIFKNTNGTPELVKTFKVATGKNRGNKLVQGDKKTPEGIYILQGFIPGADLVKRYGKEGLIYGAGSFPTNYPNVIDKRIGKTGGGIWLHSTDNDARVDKGLDSKGCVVATDADIREIAKFIDVKNTPIVITEQMPFLSFETWNSQRDEVLNFIHTWAKSWKNKDFKTYIKHYSEKEFNHARKGNYSKYRAYKKAVFSRKDKPEITFENISILNVNGYTVVQMQQNYESDIISDSGKKTLYLKKNGSYSWKIVAEIWQRLDKEQRLSFVPQQRYFKE